MVPPWVDWTLIRFIDGPFRRDRFLSARCDPRGYGGRPGEARTRPRPQDDGRVPEGHSPRHALQGHDPPQPSFLI